MSHGGYKERDQDVGSERVRGLLLPCADRALRARSHIKSNLFDYMHGAFNAP